MLSAPALTDRLAWDVQGAQALRAGAARNEPESLRAAARQFEAMLVQTLLKDMRQTRFTDGDDPLGDSDSLRLYRELLDQQWAQKISAGRGLGLAEMLVGHLERPSGEASGQAPVAPPGTVSTGETGEAPAGPVAVPAQGSGETDGRRRFLSALRPHAEATERATGVPADFILAHAALESGWGRRQIPGPDGRASHNLFGIKGGGGWSGAEVEVPTTEYRYGLAVKTTARFRAYDGYEAAFADYAGLLRHRYGAALGAGTDAEGFARALSEGGYASDPGYAAKLRRLIASVAQAGV